MFLFFLWYYCSFWGKFLHETIRSMVCACVFMLVSLYKFYSVIQNWCVGLFQISERCMLTSFESTKYENLCGSLLKELSFGAKLVCLDEAKQTWSALKVLWLKVLSWTVLLTLFYELFPTFQYDIIDRIPELLSFVYMSCTNYFCQCLFF